MSKALRMGMVTMLARPVVLILLVVSCSSALCEEKVPQPWSGPVTLRGEIAHGLKIEMRLVLEGSKLSGSYFYERIGKDIPIKGNIEKNGTVVLEEFVKGQKTGIFMGKSLSDAIIEGKWSKPGSTRSRDFFLVSTGLLQSMPASPGHKGEGQHMQTEQSLKSILKKKIIDQSRLSGDFGHILPEPPKNQPAP
jgi:hypothetical protein